MVLGVKTLAEKEDVLVNIVIGFGTRTKRTGMRLDLFFLYKEVYYFCYYSLLNFPCLYEYFQGLQSFYISDIFNPIVGI